MFEQLPLQFDYRPDYTFGSFFSGGNAEIVAHLQQAVFHKEAQQIYLWGESGLGKSHLLQACCQYAHAQHKTAFYFQLQADTLPDVSLLDGLEEVQLVCLDNIGQLAGNPLWEHAFFNFYNRHRASEHGLILSAAKSPQKLNFKLPDLQTRLGWGLTLKLKALSDNDKISVLNCKAQQLGFAISPQIGNYLLTHYSRDLTALLQLLDKIDVAMLIAKRKLTLPFLKRILAES